MSRNGVDRAEDAMPFEYVEGVHVSRVEPTSGSVYGGAELVVTGTRFDAAAEANGGALECRFAMHGDPGQSSQTVPATLVSPTEARCTAPPAQTTGVVTVDVTNLAGGFTTSAKTFTYVQMPQVLSISPQSGDVAGGTEVIVAGKHFVENIRITCGWGPLVRGASAGDERARFSIVTAATAQWLSGDRVACTAPKWKLGPGPVQLALITGGGDAASNRILSPEPFEFTVLPSVFSVEPTRVSKWGGTAVTVRGRNFVEGMESFCLIGHRGRVPAAFVSATELRCEAPIHDEGAFALEVTNNGFDYSEDAVPLRFHQPPTVTGMDPLHGAVAGGTAVRLTGEDLAGADVRCAFGELGTVAAVVESAEAVVCASPPFDDTVPGADPAVRVDVTVNGHDFVVTGKTFTYRAPSRVTRGRSTWGGNVPAI